MKGRAILVVVALVAAIWACGGNSSKAKPDAAVDAFSSMCGFPGDVGNELGIGKFCQSLADCSGTAPLCSVIGNKDTHFCTKTCQGSGSAGQCGTDTMCVCDSTNTNQCGCTPNSCLM